MMRVNTPARTPTKHSRSRAKLASSYHSQSGSGAVAVDFPSVVWAPHALTGLRMLSAPLLWWLQTQLQLEAALACLAFAVMSDAVDGPLTRWIGTPSTAGAYFDATADFAVIVSAFSAFAWIGVYPSWSVALIAI